MTDDGTAANVIVSLVASVVVSPQLAKIKQEAPTAHIAYQRAFSQLRSIMVYSSPGTAIKRPCQNRGAETLSILLSATPEAALCVYHSPFNFAVA